MTTSLPEPQLSIFLKALAGLDASRRVFFASAAPAVRFPNVYGIDLPRKEDLIANGRDEVAVVKLIGADWVVYQDLADLVECVRGLNPDRLRFGFDASVFDGRYITGDIDQRFFEQQSRRDQMQQTPSLSVPIGVSQSVSELDEQVLHRLSGQGAEMISM
ncbi:purF [Symbiodinium pilosum]|uniref:PurF protein n=1 Tax=Symbiodinium pilosum TaxID=2952 RepID=A0A812VMW0_SYMPI|nr:purF [Symbiodinium pilosum]